MNSVSRRNFLKGTAATLALLAGSGFFWDPVRKNWATSSLPAGAEILAVCSKGSGKRYKEPDGVGNVVVTQPSYVHALEVASGKIIKIDVPFWGHTLTQNPKNSKQVFTFEKWGKRGALVDLEAEETILNTEASDGNTFFGHAVGLGDLVITSEDSYQRDAGQLMLRNTSDLKIVQKMSTYGVNPHELLAIDNGKTLLVANGGHPVPNEQAGLAHDYTPNLAWIEASSGKLLHKVTFDGFQASHLAMSHDGWIFVGAAVYPWQKGYPKINNTEWPEGMQERYVRAALVSPEGKVFSVPVHPNGKELRGEALSAAFIGKSGLVAYTAFESDKVCILHYKTQQLVSWLDVASPKGMVTDTAAPDNIPTMLVSMGKERDHLLKIAVPGHGEPVVGKTMPGFGGDGAHLVRMYV